MHKPAEISLALWYLPLEKLEEVGRLVTSLKEAHGYDQPIDDSDEWTRQDELDFSRASMTYLDRIEPADEGYDDVQTR